MIERYAQFKFFWKGSGLVSPPDFVYDFSRKRFLMLHSINWPNFIVWLPLLPEILGNICSTIVCWPDCDVFKAFFIILKRFSAAKNCLRPESASLKTLLTQWVKYFLWIKKQTYFENINLEPTLHYGRMDEISKNKSSNNSCCRNDCWNMRILYFSTCWKFSLFIFGDKVDC